MCEALPFTPNSVLELDQHEAVNNVRTPHTKCYNVPLTLSPSFKCVGITPLDLLHTASFLPFDVSANSAPVIHGGKNDHL
jgi:hypothetical protein